jgi:hypothetical protein
MLDSDKLSQANERAGEEVAKTLEAADQDMPVNIGQRTRITATAMGDRGQLGLGTILAALVVVIAVSLAVIVVDRFDSSLGSPSSSQLSTAQNDVLSGFADMTSLIGPLLLVAIAVVIIGLIRRVQMS